MWLDLVRSQTDYCLRLMAHVQTSKSASELDKINVFSYLGRVMEDVRKGYDGLREICTNIRQAPFTVPPGFAKISYKFTDIKLRDYQARKQCQQLDETNFFERGENKYILLEIGLYLFSPIFNHLHHTHPMFDSVRKTHTALISYDLGVYCRKINTSQPLTNAQMLFTLTLCLFSRR